MYGIILNDHTDPYITASSSDEIVSLLRHSIRMTTDAEADYEFTMVMLDPECAWCEDLLPGWYEVDESLDFIEPPLHDHCRSAYADQQAASHYV